MPRSPKPDDTYDDNLWKGLSFLAEIWNRGPHPKKIQNVDYYNSIRYNLKNFGDYIEGAIDITITLFVEFFYLKHDDGKHRYEVCYLTDRMNDWTIAVNHENGTRNLYQPIPMNAWTCHDKYCTGLFPDCSLIYLLEHLYNRSLMIPFIKRGFISRDQLTDYEEFKTYYESKAFMSIDHQINEEPITEIPDPLHVIENEEVRKLWHACIDIGNGFMRLYETHPEMF